MRRHEELSGQELDEISRLADAWRGNETERGFSMALNRLGDRADGRCVVITAHDESGAVRGFLSFVPWGARGLSLDVMRRDRAAENGLNEYMVAHLVEAAPALLRALGVSRVVLRYLERLVTHAATFRALAGLRVWFFRRALPLLGPGPVMTLNPDVVWTGPNPLAALAVTAAPPKPASATPRAATAGRSRRRRRCGL